MAKVKTLLSPAQKLYRTFSMAHSWREQSLLPTSGDPSVTAKRWVAGKAAAFQREFADGIRRQREGQSLTLDQLATRAEVPATELSAFESGDRLPTEDTAAKLCWALDTQD